MLQALNKNSLLLDGWLLFRIVMVNKENTVKVLLKMEQLESQNWIKIKIQLKGLDGISKKMVHMTNTNLRW